MMHLINFKTQRQTDEWRGDKIDPRLRVIIYSLSGYVFDKYQKFLVITEIIRTEAERREIYKNDPVLRETIGVHEKGRGIDLRAHDFSADEINDMVGFLNSHFEYTGKHNTALAHDVSGFHLHVQVDGDGVTEIKGHLIEAQANG